MIKRQNNELDKTDLERKLFVYFMALKVNIDFSQNVSSLLSQLEKNCGEICQCLDL